jgi:hypothetical protein
MKWPLGVYTKLDRLLGEKGIPKDSEAGRRQFGSQMERLRGEGRTPLSLRPSAGQPKRCQPRSPPATALQNLAAIRTLQGKGTAGLPLLDRTGLVSASRTATKWRVICTHCPRVTTVLSAKTTSSHPRQKGIFELDACPVPGSIGKSGET